MLLLTATALLLATPALHAAYAPHSCTPLLDDASLLHPQGNNNACSSATGLTLITNPAFRICIRQASNMVDDTVRVSGGVWPDCQLVDAMLRGWQGLVVPVETGSSSIILDIGANIGACSVALAAQGHTVVAFEPKKEHVDMIKASVDANPPWRGRLHLHANGLSDKATESATLTTEDGNSGNSWVFAGQAAPHAADASTIGGRSDKHVTVDTGIKLLPLDTYCTTPFDAVKMDAQGFEAAILRGGRHTLRRGTLKRIMLEFWPFGLEAHGYSSASLLQMLVNNHYRLFADNGTEIVPATFYAFDSGLRHADAGNPWRGFGHLFSFHGSVMRS
ncbi:MAG: FkbM family methyltransferase [Rhodoferax sp.]|nr:FkbM family methyltransferase [Rhodoferax sp.]